MKLFTSSLPSAAVLCLSMVLVPASSLAQEDSKAFPDVPKGHYAYEAVNFLRANGIVQGYEDGTFKPNKGVNRAEAMKFIVAPLTAPEKLSEFTSSAFADVEDGVWFLPYIEYGHKNGIIDPPSKRPNFEGSRGVQKVEFLKMVELANGIDPISAFGEIRLPLSDDVSNPDEWYYPYLRYAVTASMTMIGSDGTFSPARELTRADTAVLLYRLLMYQQGRRAQALLSEAESEILIILGSLEKDDIVQAEYASGRALLAARGAHASKPDVPVVKAALKTTEAFRALVRAYRAGLNNDLDKVISLAGDAWNLSSKASELDSSMRELSVQVQGIAKNMADSARELKAQSGA